MPRIKTIGAALLLTLAAVSYQAVELPRPVLACSCVAPLPSLADFAHDSEVSIVVGTVGRALPDRTPVAVESWFRGPNPSDVVWLAGGAETISSCEIFMAAGEQRLLVLHQGENGFYSSSSCVPNGLIGTPDGNALLAEATAIFGAPQAPPTPAPELPASIDLAPWLGGLGWVAATVGVGAVVLLAVAFLGRRRPSG